MKILKNKKILVILAIIFIVASITTIIIKGKTKITDIEKIKLTETSNALVNYLEEIEECKSDSIDKYIVYALVYSYNEKNVNSLTIKEIEEIISDKFNVEVNEDKIEKNGITSIMIEKNVSYDPNEQKYVLNTAENSFDAIANTPIIKYSIDKMEKKKEKYIVTYNKYTIENPYRILNYYEETNKKNDSNRPNTEFEQDVRDENIRYDTSIINDYLTGKRRVKEVKEFLSDKEAEKLADQKGRVRVTYIVKKDKILVDDIETLE